MGSTLLLTLEWKGIFYITLERDHCSLAVDSSVIHDEMALRTFSSTYPASQHINIVFIAHLGA